MPEHNTLTGASLHEPKGFAAAANGSIIYKNSSGVSEWRGPMSHGASVFKDFATPIAFAATTSYTVFSSALMAAVGIHEFTESNGRLTYTGTFLRHTHIVANFTFDQTSGANRDIHVAISKNGTLISHAESVMTSSTGFKVSTAVHANVDLVTGDYLELQIKASASTTVNLDVVYLFGMGMIGA